jgi:hypothetical protein
MGLGADIAVALNPRISLRGGANFIPYQPTITSGDIDYEAGIPSPQFIGAVDLFLASGFRLSGGIRIKSGELELTGELSEPVEIGDETYDPADVGTLTGTVITKDASPYLGIGWGNVAMSRLGFFVDLGVALHGSPGVELTASGPIAGDPSFEDDLDREAQALEEDLEAFKVYPILSLGVSFGF